MSARLSILALSLCGLGLNGCGAEAPTAEEIGEAASALRGDELSAEGSFSCDFGLPAALPLDQVPGIIERDRMYMAERPGMQHKHLPLAFDPATGNLFSGGRYLFDTAKQAEDYKQWVSNDFILDGTKFLERPIFLAPECHAWSVIGAHDFKPIAAQLVLRTERWSVPENNAKHELRDLWDGIRHEADQRDLAAVWLLYSKHEHLAQLVYFADRVAPNDPTAPDFASLGALAGSPALGHSLASLGGSKTFDRSEWILTVWSPFKAGDHGAPSLWPYSPPFPAPFCGDNTCEPSRGETHESCAADCASGCGNNGCQPGEDTRSCPSDCRL
ncbi:MAG: hypothetical protein ABI193_10080 [Minicystis sp.]